MLKILHFADLHLDSSFAGLGFPSLTARKYREALKDAFVRIINLATEKKVDIITIGGDLYEHERFTRDTGEFLRTQLQRLWGKKIFIAPGNHDPWMPESMYHYLDWSDNVHIFQKSSFSPIRLAANVTLWGMAHCSFSNHKNPVENFKVDRQGINVLLFHGSDMSNIPPNKGKHAPFNLENLEATGADVALLGHYHRGKIGESAKIKLIYPGSPEPLGFAEKGMHSVALVSINNNQIEIETFPVNHYNFVQMQVDVSNATTRDEIKNLIEKSVREQSSKTTLFRVEITGQIHPELDLDLALLKEQVFINSNEGQLINKTKPCYDFESLSQENTVRGEFVRRIKMMQENAILDEKEKLQQALLFGLNAFESKER